MGGRPATLPTAPPDVDTLLTLDPATWHRVVAHLRRVLAELPAPEQDARTRRVAAAPTSRMLSGRVRREAVAMVADGAGVWSALRRRIEADADLAGALANALAAPPDRREVAAAPPRVAEDTGEIDRLRDRLRETRQQRDDARRRADGETARADREQQRREALESDVASLREQVAALETQVAEAKQQVRDAVERERRRGEAARAEVAADLRRVRREQAERDQRQRTPPPTRPPVPSAPVPPPRLVPGRPSRLPSNVREDTTEAADLLLHEGRRVLVDGYNVTRTQRADLDLDGQRRWLVNLLAAGVASRRIDPTVVFDGHASPGPGSSRRDRGVMVVFTAEGVSADDDLVFQVEASDLTQPMVLVTDDRELRERLAVHRVDLLSTRGLVDALR